MRNIIQASFKFVQAQFKKSRSRSLNNALMRFHETNLISKTEISFHSLHTHLY